MGIGQEGTGLAKLVDHTTLNVKKLQLLQKTANSSKIFPKAPNLLTALYKSPPERHPSKMSAITSAITTAILAFIAGIALFLQVVCTATLQTMAAASEPNGATKPESFRTKFTAILIGLEICIIVFITMLQIIFQRAFQIKTQDDAEEGEVVGRKKEEREPAAVV